MSRQRLELPADRENIKELTIAVLGNANSGKSTLTGVLTNPEFSDWYAWLIDRTRALTSNVLDDGNGSARGAVLQFDHEKSSGRTSSITYQYMVLDDGYKVISFVDLAGHESYLRTTITGVTSSYPDYAFICVEKTITNMTNEHLAVVLSLDIPFAILMTKIDIVPESKIKSNAKALFKRLRRVGKRAIIIKNKKDLDFFAQNAAGTDSVPIILVSCVSGYGLENVVRVLNFVVRRQPNIPPNVFVIDNVFNVVGFGIVVSGITSFDIQKGDDLYLGPFSGGRTQPEYIKAKVRTIHDDYRNFVNILPAGRRGCLCLRINSVQRKCIRSGMVLVRNVNDAAAVSHFTAMVQIFDGHASTIKAGYSAFINSGIIKSTVVITRVESDDGCIRSGDTALVDIKFLRHKYCVVPGEKFILREGGIRGIGIII